mmetsp:Transcript_34850/g.81416  ORF Transcript_34850/g.81416 Transcript_34850/m.81416 type:complete len:209 (-) Transcript_34850:884-1510(-)
MSTAVLIFYRDVPLPPLILRCLMFPSPIILSTLVLSSPLVIRCLMLSPPVMRSAHVSVCLLLKLDNCHVELVSLCRCHVVLLLPRSVRLLMPRLQVLDLLLQVLTLCFKFLEPLLHILVPCFIVRSAGLHLLNVSSQAVPLVNKQSMTLAQFLKRCQLPIVGSLQTIQSLLPTAVGRHQLLLESAGCVSFGFSKLNLQPLQLPIHINR